MGVPMPKYWKHLAPIGILNIVQTDPFEPSADVFNVACNVVIDFAECGDEFVCALVNYGPFFGRTLKVPECLGKYCITLSADKSVFKQPWLSCEACRAAMHKVTAVFKQDNLKHGHGVLIKAVWAKLVLSAPKPVWANNHKATDVLNKIGQDNSFNKKKEDAWRQFQFQCKTYGRWGLWMHRSGLLGVEVLSDSSKISLSPEDTLLARFSHYLKRPEYAGQKGNVIIGLLEALVSKTLGKREPMNKAVLDCMMMIRRVDPKSCRFLREAIDRVDGKHILPHTSTYKRKEKQIVQRLRANSKGC